MFSLQNQSAKLTSVNPRAEFHPSLKSSLYGKGDAAQGDLIEPVETAQLQEAA